MNAGADERFISGHWGLEMATLIDPPTQESVLASTLDMWGPRQGAVERMNFQQAWAKIHPKLVTPITLGDLEDMPAATRRCLDEKIVDAAMQDVCHRSSGK